MEIEWLILADAAQVVDRKLYLMGGGWDRLTVNKLPHQQTMAVALSIVVPWNDANIRRSFNIQIVTEDGQQIANVPGQFEVGRPPGATPGQGLRAQVALGVNLSFSGVGRFEVVATVEDAEERRFSFAVAAGPGLDTGQVG
jgi:hypothetical protein